MRSPLLTFAVAAAMLAPALSACTQVDPSATTVVRRVVEPLPLLEGEDLDGRPISSEDFRGEVLVVNVWGSWCGPCEQEQPELVRVAEDYADRGVAFLGINYADQVAAAREFVRRFEVPYPSLVDEAGKTAAQLGYLGLPDTYIVDAEGTMRVAIAGPTSGSQLGALLDEVLAGS